MESLLYKSVRSWTSNAKRSFTYHTNCVCVVCVCRRRSWRTSCRWSSCATASTSCTTWSSTCTGTPCRSTSRSTCRRWAPTLVLYLYRRWAQTLVLYLYRRWAQTLVLYLYRRWAQTLVLYLYRNSLQKYIEIYVQKVSCKNWTTDWISLTGMELAVKFIIQTGYFS